MKTGKQTDKNSWTHTTVRWLLEVRGWRVVKDIRGQLYGNGRRFDFGWGAHNATYT